MMCCIYAQRLVRYRIFVWRSQLILWPLLRLLRFVINVRNKCVTSSLGEWRSSCNDNHKFLVHQLPPLFVFLSFRRDKNKSIWCFVFRVLCIYNSFDVWVVECHVYGQDALVLRTCLGFPTRVLAICFAFFPPLSFSLYFFPYPISVLRFVSSLSSLSLSCVP